MRYPLILLVLILMVAAIVPRALPDPFFPQTNEALEVKMRAERFQEAWSAANGIDDWLLNKFIVQRVIIENYRELPGSCSGFPDQPKADPAYDRLVDVSEIGPFGIRIKTWHAICGGRLPRTGPVMIAASKAEWDALRKAEDLEVCKKRRLNCGYLGDFRNTGD